VPDAAAAAEVVGAALGRSFAGREPGVPARLDGRDARLSTAKRPHFARLGRIQEKCFCRSSANFSRRWNNYLPSRVPPPIYGRARDG